MVSYEIRQGGSDNRPTRRNKGLFNPDSLRQTAVCTVVPFEGRRPSRVLSKLLNGVGLLDTVVSQDDAGNVSEDLLSALLVFVAATVAGVTGVVVVVIIVAVLEGSEGWVGLNDGREGREGWSSEELHRQRDTMSRDVCRTDGDSRS